MPFYTFDGYAMNLRTRTARSALKPAHTPYFATIDRGLALGYRKSGHGPGTWYGRRRVAGRYLQRVIGTADDDTEADGQSVLSYRQAVAALERFEDLEPDQSPPARARTSVYTVERAMADYLDWYALERKAVQATRQTIDGHIIPALGNVPVDRLTTAKIRRFRDQIATTAKRNRGRLMMDPDPAKWTEEQKRQRKATANRVLTVLKAALTHAWRDGKAKDKTQWERVKPFHAVEKPRIDYFTPEEARALLQAAEPDFRDLAHAALLTGCRYGELAELRAGDVKDDYIDLLRTKGNKPRAVPLTDEARELFARLAKGKPDDVRVFLRADGSPWLKSYQTRPMRRACAEAGIEPAKSFHILRHTFAVMLLREHVPVEFVAQALGNSVQICQRHYAHVVPEDLAGLMARMPRIAT